MSRWRTRQSLAVAVVLLVVLFAGIGEMTVRWLGFVDAPLYRRTADGGYSLAENQSGTFLRKNRWAFDDQGLGVAPRFHLTDDGILLVGDSLVFGGNPLDQPDKLGPRLAEATGRPVWPLAAGGWALSNEIEVLRRHPKLLQLPTLVWVSNSGDFGAPATWTNEIGMPTRPPASALIYGFRRYVMKPHDVIDSPTGAASERRWKADLLWLLRTYRSRILWVLYPRRSEIGWPIPSFAPLLSALGGRAEIVDVGRSSR